MRAAAGGVIVGALSAFLILAVGLTVAAYVVIGVALLAIVAGLADYSRKHG